MFVGKMPPEFGLDAGDTLPETSVQAGWKRNRTW
jgi:hypothetical protein